MARNGSGTFSVVNTFVAGTTITASDHNENWSDLAADVTNSLALDGQSVMTGAFKAASGTAAAPGIAFGSDTGTGLYRIGANNLGVVVGGAIVLDVSASGLDVTGLVSQGGGMPGYPGEIKIWPGATEPTGWVFCNGQELAQADNAALYAVLGTTYNTGGETSGYFRVPNFSGRVPAGKESSATLLTSAVSGIDGATLGATGGSQSNTLTQAQLPNVTLTTSIASGQGSHTHPSGVKLLGTFAGGSPFTLTEAGTGITTGASTLPAMSGTTPLGGSGDAHNNVQPAIIVNFIIKT